MRVYVCVWGKEGGGRFWSFSQRNFVWFSAPVLILSHPYPPLSHFFDDVTAYLRSKNQVWKRHREVSCYCKAVTQTTLSLLKFSFNPKEPLSMKETQEKTLLAMKHKAMLFAFEAWWVQAVWHWKPNTERNTSFFLFDCRPLSFIMSATVL